MNAYFAGWTRARLRLVIGAFFLALGVPALLLVRQGFSQLELDALRQQQVLAEQFVRGVDQRLAVAIREQEARGFDDYGFWVGPAGLRQRSSLSAFPVAGSIPGLLGHFQVDANGELSTPLLPIASFDPAELGIPADEHARRLALQERIRRVLAQNRLARAPTLGTEQLDDGGRAAALATRVDAVDADAGELEQKPGQAVFDQLLSSAASGVASPAASLSPAAEPAAAPVIANAEDAPARLPAELDRSLDSVQAVLEERIDVGRQQPVVREEEAAARLRVSTFDSELDPFTFSMLATGDYVVFRNAWRDGQRFVQGALIEPEPFLEAALRAPLLSSALAVNTSLRVSYAGRTVGVGGGGSRPPGAPLLSTRLSPPFADLELHFEAGDLPLGPGRALLVWVTAALLVVLSVGCIVLYRFGWGQMQLLRQQQDFVSAVSHELKTPLTSIRMYGEMLKSGWADDAKKQAYYDYILDESERLSRLIENVLQLARMTRHKPDLELVDHEVGELLDMAKQKVATQLERAEFELHIVCDAALRSKRIAVDMDAFTQVVINLADNAVKFAAEAENKTVELTVKQRQDGDLQFAVRDFGPGVPRTKMRKLFELFYRPENELTRATRGTGIGLALVRQLVQAMHGQIDVRNRNPGAEFVIHLPEATATGTS